MRSLVASHRGSGNLVLVSHGSTIAALTGISPSTGEMVIVTRSADGVTVNGRLSVAVP